MKKIFCAVASAILLSGCAVENIDYLAPIMVTHEPENILTTSASLGGIALGEGGKDITEYGLVWGTVNPPSINDNKIPKGSRLGQFFDNYDIFQPETTYYYRTYGINDAGTGYGETFEFTTQGLPSCTPTQNNRMNTGFYFNTININNVTLTSGNDSMFDGNVEFETSTNNSTIRIFLKFNEIGLRLPLTGTYTINGGFDSQSPFSAGEVDVYLYNYGSSIGGAEAILGQKIYLENNNGTVTFIFCDVAFNEYYTLNGKFTYTP